MANWRSLLPGACVGSDDRSTWRGATGVGTLGRISLHKATRKEGSQPLPRRRPVEDHGNVLFTFVLRPQASVACVLSDACAALLHPPRRRPGAEPAALPAR
jgi:hypothetical protein